MNKAEYLMKNYGDRGGYYPNLVPSAFRGWVLSVEAVDRDG